MASNYTENYGLCQWETKDQVLREEFNEDNVKMDEALQSAFALAQKAINVAEHAFSDKNFPLIIGIYTGDGLVKRKIELGFTPQLVYVSGRSGQTAYRPGTGIYYCGGLALPGHNVSTSAEGEITWENGNTVLAIEEGGFSVSSTQSSSSRMAANDANMNYYYIALK